MMMALMIAGAFVLVVAVILIFAQYDDIEDS